MASKRKSKVEDEAEEEAEEEETYPIGEEEDKDEEDEEPKFKKKRQSVVQLNTRQRVGLLWLYNNNHGFMQRTVALLSFLWLGRN
jgi:hypothetical protein